MEPHNTTPLMLEAAPQPSPQPSAESPAAEVLRRFDRPSSEWGYEDVKYYNAVVCNSLEAEEGSHERLVRNFMDTVRHARIRAEAREYVRSEIGRRLAKRTIDSEG